MITGRINQIFARTRYPLGGSGEAGADAAACQEQEATPRPVAGAVLPRARASPCGGWRRGTLFSLQPAQTATPAASRI